ncbi:MAG: hypothetical protein ACK4WF_09725, partial [Candidatus Brocadiales bacterium]
MKGTVFFIKSKTGEGLDSLAQKTRRVLESTLGGPTLGGSAPAKKSVNTESPPFVGRTPCFGHGDLIGVKTTFGEKGNIG